jgi:hypothetical protein
MPIAIPIPEGMQPPQEPVFVVPVTFELRDGMLYALEVDGMPIPGGEPEAPEEEAGPGFLDEVERGFAEQGM